MPTLLKTLTQQGGTIVQLNTANSGDEGAFNFGIFLQTVGNGRQYVFKLSDASAHYTSTGSIDWSRTKEVAKIHVKLAALGLAPRLLAYSYAPQDICLVASFLNSQLAKPIDRRFLTEGIVYVMAYVPFAWNFRKRLDTPPDF
jgi:hypothetical protein